MLESVQKPETVLQRHDYCTVYRSKNRQQSYEYIPSLLYVPPANGWENLLDALWRFSKLPFASEKFGFGTVGFFCYSTTFSMLENDCQLKTHAGKDYSKHVAKVRFSCAKPP